MKKLNVNDRLNVLVIGAGMYVAGKGSDSFGTILPALNELYREGVVGRISVAATSKNSIQAIKRKTKLLTKMTGTTLDIDGFPRKKRTGNAYLEAISFHKPDCAIIVVPDHLHYKIGHDLIKNRIHTLMVKPLTPTTDKARRLINGARKKNLYCAVEFHKRFDEANLKLRDVLKEGKIGEPLYITVEYSQKRFIPLAIFKKWVNKTNIFQYLGVHYVDIIYFATGARPLRVLATGQKRFLKRHGINNYDSIQVVIEWRSPNGNKFISTILTNWIDPNTASAMSDQKIKVIGTMGRYESDQKNRGVQIVTEREGIEDFNPYFTQCYSKELDRKKFFRGYGIESVKQFCKDALNIKRGIRKARDFDGQRPTFKDALVSTSVLEAVNKSLKSDSSWIDIKL